MRRPLVLAALILCVPVCAFAQDAPAAADGGATPAATAPKPRPRNAFSQAIADLTRAAQEQHAAQVRVTASADAGAPAQARKPGGNAPAAPVALADSGGR